MTAAHLFRRMMLGVATFALTQPAPAQRSISLSGRIELSGAAGFGYGSNRDGIVTGANFSYLLSRFVLPFGEFNYFRTSSNEQSQTTTGTGIVQQSLALKVRRYDVHGGAQIPVPFLKGQIRPYGSFGLGVLWSVFDGSGSIVFPGTPPVPVVIHDQDTALAINFGGGVRYYASRRMGFRLEFTGYRPFSHGFGGTVYKVQGQIFVRLK